MEDTGLMRVEEKDELTFTCAVANRLLIDKNSNIYYIIYAVYNRRVYITVMGDRNHKTMRIGLNQKQTIYQKGFAFFMPSSPV